MSALAIVREVIGLFVDDGSLALAVLGVVAVAAIAALLGAPVTAGILLLAGCLAALTENVLRARSRR
jgi:hypothetical protein